MLSVNGDIELAYPTQRFYYGDQENKNIKKNIEKGKGDIQ